MWGISLSSVQSRKMTDETSLPYDSTCACECSVLTSDFRLISIQLPDVVRAATASTSVRRLTGKPHLSVWQQKRKGLSGWRERGRRKEGEKIRQRSYFLDTGKTHFSSDVTAQQTQTLFIFSAFCSYFFPFPHSSAPLSYYFGTRLSFSKAAIFFPHIMAVYAAILWPKI